MSGYDIKLTDREMEVLQLVAKEYTSKEISDELEISQSTVEGYRKAIYLKLGARNMAGAVLKAIKLGLLDTG